MSECKIEKKKPSSCFSLAQKTNVSFSSGIFFLSKIMHNQPPPPPPHLFLTADPKRVAFWRYWPAKTILPVTKIRSSPVFPLLGVRQKAVCDPNAELDNVFPFSNYSPGTRRIRNERGGKKWISIFG